MVFGPTNSIPIPFPKAVSIGIVVNPTILFRIIFEPLLSIFIPTTPCPMMILPIPLSNPPTCALNVLFDNAIP